MGKIDGISVLFADPRGVYANLCADVWCEARDARLYAGPSPVVAHPPCQLWGNFARLNYSRWGGDHNRPGNDGGCFASALASVRKYGGVLEHPAATHAWQAHGLMPPSGIGWARASALEYVCEVWQSAYGHKARKRTWLLYVGSVAPFELRWTRTDGTHQVGFGWAPTKPILSKRAANATPIAFAVTLIALAVGCKCPA